MQARKGIRGIVCSAST